MTEDVVGHLRAKLLNPSTPLPQKYRVLFSLRNIAGTAAGRALEDALTQPSALLRHEVAYCLGQRQDPSAVATLVRVLGDVDEHPMVRHEAGEALGAIGTDACLGPLRDHVEDDADVVAETCRLALERIEQARESTSERDNAGESSYLSVDPAFPAPAHVPTQELEATLLNESARMSERYAAMFAIRNRGGAEAVRALCKAFSCRSALLKHEVAYVLGQMQDPGAVPRLIGVLNDRSEAAMVRHEAAEALGSIAQEGYVELLESGAKDEEPIVAESCLVALDMLEYERSGGFQYADMADDSGRPAALSAIQN